MKTIVPDLAERPMTETGDLRPGIPAHPILPDEQALWRLYQQQSGGAAENALVERYLPLVGSILKRLASTFPNEVDREDLYSAGLVGLLGALRKFNPDAGVPFDSYARQRIRGAMLDEMRRMDWVPRDIREKSKILQQTVHTLEQQLGRSPTKTETARAMKLSVSDFDQLVDKIRPAQFVRLDATCENDGESETCLSELIAEPNPIDPLEMAAKAELKQIIFLKLKEMPVMQQKVLTLYYLEDLRLSEIARAMGLTEGRISQIHSQALQSLRTHMRRHESGLSGQPATPALAQRKSGLLRTVSRQDTLADSPSKNHPAAAKAEVVTF